MDEILKESKKYADKSESKRGGKTSK